MGVEFADMSGICGWEWNLRALILNVLVLNIRVVLQ